MPYQYQPLPVLHNSEDVYIRLLEIHKGPPSGPITGRLYTTLLSEAPAFYAVSYCWGSMTRKGTIHITNAAPPRDLENDNTLEIPATLIPFLYQIRGRRFLKARTLWVDSVCLNQLDSVEKTANVPKMRQVYMKADVTVSWLGLEADGSAAAFDYAYRLHKFYRRELAGQGQIALAAEEEKGETFRVQIKLGDPTLEALLKILDRPYFERAWIVQEVVVSSQTWFMCGNAWVPWTSFAAAFLYLMTNQQWLWEFYHGVRIHAVVLMKLSEMEWAGGDDLHWSGTLLRHRQCLSEDPRDKVYAFYGMRCKNALQELGIEPEYETTTTEVLYTRLAARALHKAQVTVLHVPRLVTSFQEQRDPDFKRCILPSWVPDWRWSEETPMSLLNSEMLTNESIGVPDYHASKECDFKPGFDLPAYNTPRGPIKEMKQLPKKLRLHAVTIAKVTRLTPRRWVIQKASGRLSLLEQARVLQFNMQQIHEWEALFRPQKATQIYAATGELATRAMYETFMAGETQNTPEVKTSASAAFERRQRFLRLLHTFRIHSFLVCYIVVVLVERVFRRFGWVNPEAQFRMMVGHMANRKGAQMVNIKDSGLRYYALVPSICRLGDHVVLVGGVTTPLILRPTGKVTIQSEDGQPKTIPTWELIGDCYVHGIMKGELWETREIDREDMWVA
jgi:hypothetical protein